MPRSGKDTLAELFMQSGYFGFSFGDFVRKNSVERHKDKPDPISVANMTETSNWLRETYGADVVLKEALKEFEAANSDGKYKGVVLFSVRAPVEADFILEKGGELIWVDTADEVRYERGLKNMRAGEAKISPEEFKRQEALQWQPQPGIPEKSQMNVAYIKQKATHVFENNGDDIEEFEKKAYSEFADFLN